MIYVAIFRALIRSTSVGQRTFKDKNALPDCLEILRKIYTLVRVIMETTYKIYRNESKIGGGKRVSEGVVHLFCNCSPHRGPYVSRFVEKCILISDFYSSSRISYILHCHVCINSRSHSLLDCFQSPNNLID